MVKKNDTQIIAFAIYKQAPLSDFVCYTALWIAILFVFRGIAWMQGRTPFTILSSLMIGVLVGCMIYVPTYLSALIMHAIGKPVLRFDAHGFYYTPQLWSKSKLYRWEHIHTIDIGYGGDDQLLIKVYMVDGKSVFIDETIIPIDHTQLLKIFQRFLKNVHEKK